MSRHLKFSTRLFLSVLLLVTVTFTLGGNMLLYASFRSACDREAENSLVSYRLMQFTAAAVGVNERDVQLSRVVNALSQMHLDPGTALRLRIDDSVAYSSSTDEGVFRPVGRETAETELLEQVFVGEDGLHYLQITGALPLGNLSAQLDGVFRIESAYESLHTQQRLYREIFCAVMVLGALMALGLMRLLTKPLKALSTTSRKIADGDLTCRAEVQGSDEFALLAADVNHMADELNARIDALTDSMRRQEEFTGAFAHEMKTPMTSLIGYADLLRSRTLSEMQQQKAANYIFTESKRLEQLSVKLLDLLVLKRRDFPMHPCEISKLTEEVVRGMAPVLAEQKIVIKGSGEQGERLVEGDLLKTLIMNLIDNARKAMPDGGEIRVRQQLTPDGIILSVTDTGYGMEPEELEKITEAFYRVDKSRSRAQGGVGLGLAICAEIAALHHGTLRFESRPGAGTKVTLTTGGEMT